LPSALPLPTTLAMLAVPAVAFPTDATPPPPVAKCRRGYKLDKHHRCVKTKKARRRGKRASHKHR
jgi:hypothetical protein